MGQRGAAANRVGRRLGVRVWYLHGKETERKSGCEGERGRGARRDSSSPYPRKQAQRQDVAVRHGGKDTQLLLLPVRGRRKKRKGKNDFFQKPS